MKLLEETERLVGHYTSLSVVCELILHDRRIRFSPLRDMNDPRENKERMVNVGWSGDPVPPTEERMAAADTLRRAYLDYSKVFCGTVDADNPHRLNTKRCFGRPRMWAQYAGNHRGICLVFDLDALGREIDVAHAGSTVYSGAVIYDDSLKSACAGASDLDYDRIKQVGSETAIREQVERFRHGLFFRKDSDWVGESEHRWVIHRWERGYEHAGIGDSLVAIVMGVDCPEVYAPAVKKVANGTPVFHLEWHAEDEDFYVREL